MNISKTITPKSDQLNADDSNRWSNDNQNPRGESSGF